MSDTVSQSIETIQVNFLKKETSNSKKETFHVQAVKDIYKMLEGTRDNSDLNILNGDVTLDDEPTFLRSSNLNFDFSVNQDS